MSKIFSATADAEGKVKVNGVSVPGVIVMSEGKAVSTGLLFMQDGYAYYVPSSASDVASTIQGLIDTLTDLTAALTTIGSTLTAIGGGMTGPTTAPPPTLPTSVADINSKVTHLNQIKTDLTTLKGGLK